MLTLYQVQYVDIIQAIMLTLHQVIPMQYVDIAIC